MSFYNNAICVLTTSILACLYSLVNVKCASTEICSQYSPETAYNQTFNTINAFTQRKELLDALASKLTHEYALEAHTVELVLSRNDNASIIAEQKHDCDA